MSLKYINPEALSKLNSLDKENLTIPQVTSAISRYLKPHKNKDFITEILINRINYVIDICENLNDAMVEVIMLGGMLGAGKSSVIKAAITFTNIDVVKFWYECSIVSTLDDIYVALYSFLQKYIKDPRRYEQQKQSIDEKVLSYLNHLSTPLLFILDNIEFLLNTNDDFDNKDIKNFIDFLIKNKQVKLILSGQRIPFNLLPEKYEAIFKLRILGLEQNKFEKILKTQIPSLDKLTLDELYEYSRGYPWICLLIIAVLHSRIETPRLLIDTYKKQNLNFEGFIAKELFLALSDPEKHIVQLAACIRHHVTQNILFACTRDNKVSEEDLNRLITQHILQGNVKRFYLNTVMRDTVISNTSTYDLYKLHRILRDFYGSESIKIFNDRITRLSRTIIDQEKAFHENTLAALEKASNKLDREKHLAINYMPRAMLDAMYWGNILKDAKKEDQVAINTTDPKSIEEEKSVIKTNQLKQINQYDAISLKDIDKLDDPRFIQEHFADILDPEDLYLSDVQPKKLTLEDKISDYFPDHMPSSKEEDIKVIVQEAQKLITDKKWVEAANHLHEGLLLAKNMQQQEAQTEILGYLINVYLNTKNHEKAIETLKENYQLHQSLNKIHEVHQNMVQIGEVYKTTYKHDLALESFFHLLAEYKEQDMMPDILARIYVGIAEIYDYRSHFFQAKEYYVKALDYLNKTHNKTAMADVLAKIGLLFDDLRDSKNAIKYYNMALKEEKTLNRKNKLADLITNIAAVLEETGQYKEAATYYRQSLALDKQSSNYRGMYHSYGKLGNLYSELEDYPLAFKCYRNELNVAKALKNQIWIGMSYLDLGDLYYFLKQYHVAAKHFASAEYYLGESITTNSKEKLERRILSVVSKIGRAQYNNLLESMKKFHAAS